MLFSVEQAFVGREEIRAPLKMPAWEATGLPAVYPDLCTRHDWLVKKGLCFVCRDRQSG